MNPSQVNIRSAKSLPIRGTQTLVLESRVTEMEINRIEDLRDELWEYAKDICKEAKPSLESGTEVNWTSIRCSVGFRKLLFSFLVTLSRRQHR
jgi:hypothetical protein